jgi:DHA1 family bicyclomycin/chloramphenicol resistance-like MFS transporter
MRGPSRSIVIVLAAASTFGTLIPGIYVPAAADLASSLRAGDRLFQIAVSGYFATYALSSLLVGPIADRLGGRRSLLLALSITASAALLCAVASRPEPIVAALMLQGVGTCAGGVVVRSIVVDFFDRESAVEVLVDRF